MAGAWALLPAGTTLALGIAPLDGSFCKVGRGADYCPPRASLTVDIAFVAAQVRFHTVCKNYASGYQPPRHARIPRHGALARRYRAASHALCLPAPTTAGHSASN